MKSPYLQVEHSGDSREYTGNMLNSLWRMSDRLFEPVKAPCWFCNGDGSVPANSGSDVADRRCPECRGKGVIR
jgi:DnaJ-class molecular chaperone